MKNLRKGKNKNFLISSELLYPSILTVVFFCLIFFGLNHFYADKMEYFKKSPITIVGNIRLSFVSDKLITLDNTNKSDKILFYLNISKHNNNNIYENIASLKLDDLLTLLKSEIIYDNSQQIIFRQIELYLKEYKFNDPFCENLRIEQAVFFNDRSQALNILNIKYILQDKATTHLIAKKNLQYDYENKVNLCHKVFENLVIEKLDEKYKELHLLQYDILKLQIGSLKINDNYKVLGIKIKLDEELKKSALEVLNDQLKELDFLIDDKNKTKLFKTHSRYEQIDVSIGRGNYINEKSIFFIISLLMSIIFFFTAKIFKKIYYKF